MCNGKNGTYPSEESTVRNDKIDNNFKSIIGKLNEYQKKFHTKFEKYETEASSINLKILQIVSNQNNTENKIVESKSDWLEKFNDFDSKIQGQIKTGREQSELKSQSVDTKIETLATQLREMKVENDSYIAFRVTGTDKIGKPG